MAASVYNVHAISLVENDTVIANKFIPRGTFLMARSPSTDHMNIYTYRPQSVGAGNTTTVPGELLVSGGKIGITGAKVKSIDLVEKPALVGATYLKPGLLLMSVDATTALSLSGQTLTVQPTDGFILDLRATEQDPQPDTAGTGSILFDGSNVGLDDTNANEELMSFVHVDWNNLIPILMSQPGSRSTIAGSDTAFSVTAAGGSSTLGYQWTWNGASIPGATNPTLSLVGVQTNQAGSYAVVITNFAGSVTSAVASLTVKVPASLVTQPENQIGIAGQGVSFSAAATGSPAPGYQWLFNGANIIGATNATLVLTGIQTNQAGDYQVVVTNSSGSATSVVATLTVNVPPSISEQPQSQSKTTGQSVTFRVVAAGTGPLTYQWKFNNVPLSNAISAEIFLGDLQTSNAGEYSVSISNPAGTLNSAAAVLTVSAPAPVELKSPTGAMNDAGFNFQFQVPTGTTYIVQASSNLVDWIPIATNVAENASVTFTDSSLTQSSARYYRVVTP